MPGRSIGPSRVIRRCANAVRNVSTNGRAARGNLQHDVVELTSPKCGNAVLLARDPRVWHATGEHGRRRRAGQRHGHGDRGRAAGRERKRIAQRRRGVAKRVVDLWPPPQSESESSFTSGPLSNVNAPTLFGDCSGNTVRSRLTVSARSFHAISLIGATPLGALRNCAGGLTCDGRIARTSSSGEGAISEVAHLVRRKQLRPRAIARGEGASPSASSAADAMSRSGWADSRRARTASCRRPPR